MANVSYLETIRSLRRSAKTIWGAFRRSPSGMFGLIIILAFVIMAVFAPVLSPYTPQQTAPDSIQFMSDSGHVTVNMNNISEPTYLVTQIGGRGGSESTTGIVVYNNTGHARVYDLSVTGNGSKLQLKIKDYHNYTIPQGIDQMYSFIYDPTTSMSYVGLANHTVYILSSSFSVTKSYNLTFPIQYFSGIFDKYPFSSYSPTMGFAVSGMNHTFLFIEEGNFSALTNSVKYYSFTMQFNTVSNVISSPLLYLYLSSNPEIIIPTQDGITDFSILETPSIFNLQLSAGNLQWSSKLEYPNGSPYSILPTGITFPDNSPSLESNVGKNVIMVPTTDNYILEYSRSNGTLLSMTKATFVNNAVLSGLYSGQYITGNITMPVSFYSNGKSYVTFWNPLTNKLSSSNYYATVQGKIIGSIQYINGANEFMATNQNLAYYIPVTKSAGNVSYLPMPSKSGFYPLYIGNVIQGGVGAVIAGNYVVTVNGNGLFYESVVGYKISPLPPGSYKDPATGQIYNYPLGTDYEGHSIWAWIVYGARLELTIGIIAAISSVLIGVFIGILSGYFGGVMDALIMRLVDVFLSLPFLIFVILLVSLLGPNIWYVVVAIVIFSWAGTARVVRAVTLSLKERPYIDASRAQGASNGRIMTTHILPNVLPLTFFYMSTGVGGVIITEATLDFLGFGDPTSVTWGMLLQFLQTTGYTLLAPWWLIPPGVAIILLSLSFYLVGRAFDEIVNPRLRRR